MPRSRSGRTPPTSSTGPPTPPPQPSRVRSTTSSTTPPVRAAAGRDMTTPRGFRDRADDSLLTLLGDVPELVRNLVTAEIESAKKWAARTAKEGGWGALW